MLKVFSEKKRRATIGCTVLCIVVLLFALCACGTKQEDSKKDDTLVKQEEILAEDMAKSVFLNIKTQFENATNAKAMTSYTFSRGEVRNVISTVGNGDSQIYYRSTTVREENEPEFFLEEYLGKVQNDNLLLSTNVYYDGHYDDDVGYVYNKKPTTDKSYYRLTERQFNDEKDFIWNEALSHSGDFFGEATEDTNALWGGKKISSGNSVRYEIFIRSKESNRTIIMEDGKVVEATIEYLEDDTVFHVTIEYDFTDLRMPSTDGYTYGGAWQ